MAREGGGSTVDGAGPGGIRNGEPGNGRRGPRWRDRQQRWNSGDSASECRVGGIGGTGGTVAMAARRHRHGRQRRKRRRHRRHRQPEHRRRGPLLPRRCAVLRLRRGLRDRAESAHPCQRWGRRRRHRLVGSRSERRQTGRPVDPDERRRSRTSDRRRCRRASTRRCALSLPKTVQRAPVRELGRSDRRIGNRPERRRAARQSGLKIDADVDVVAGKTTNLVLDFDACKSVVRRGNSGAVQPEAGDLRVAAGHRTSGCGSRATWRRRSRTPRRRCLCRSMACRCGRRRRNRPGASCCTRSRQAPTTLS